MNGQLSFHYYNSNALLVVNPKGLIRVVHTPFRALCINAIDDIPINTWVYVEEVLCTSKYELIYIIHGKLFAHKHFTLTVNF